MKDIIVIHVVKYNDIDETKFDWRIIWNNYAKIAAITKARLNSMEQTV